MTPTTGTITSPAPNAWERAYLRFETPAEEVAKFLSRFRRLGVETWDRDSIVLDLFCGRGSGEKALRQLGFTRIIGVDLSEPLMRTRKGVGPDGIVADACRLPIADHTADIAIVQGGLHHLPRLPDDLHRTLDEVTRVLKPGGRFVMIEPWDTPFLRLAHRVSDNPVVRRLSRKMDALATMTALEIETYRQWLTSPTAIVQALGWRFTPLYLRNHWGKAYFVGLNTPPPRIEARVVARPHVAPDTEMRRDAVAGADAVPRRGPERPVATVRHPEIPGHSESRS